SPSYIARVAVEEDVDAVGLSILSGSHLDLVRDTVASLREHDGAGIRLFVGGTIPPEDVPMLEAAGAAGVFNASQRLEDVIGVIERCLASG
ncbi:MAG: cobalamin B12-binding domain-containing protein, partial [Gammaproteobacteria bacterium]